MSNISGMNSGFPKIDSLESLRRNLSGGDSDDKNLVELYKQLLEHLRSMKRVAVAFSGGVDSVLLLFAAFDALGENAVAVTVTSEFFPEQESHKASEFCRRYGIEQQVIKFDCLSAPGIADNTPDRCYRCKLALMEQLKQVACGIGAQLIEGSNASDALAYRPGSAALRELGVVSPLADVGMTKANVRAVARALGLPEWNKPSLACLATRFPYGQRITREGLCAVNKAEELLRNVGFTQVRVRVHNDVARVELLPNEMYKLFNSEAQKPDGLANSIYSAFRALGFNYTAIDLLGYRTGSADEVLEDAFGGRQ